MVKDFADRNEWALILGGSSGLGLASAKKLARHGLNIILIYRARRSDVSQIEQEAAKIEANGVKCLHFNTDALNTEKRNELIAELSEKLSGGRIRLLLHSIAKGNVKAMTGDNALKHDDFVITIEAMAISFYDWTKAILDTNLFARDARAIAFTSEGNRKAWPYYAAVSAAKTALEAIMRNMALEFAPHGLRTNCIEAGITDTFSFRMIPGNEKLATHTEKRNPFKRLTRPEDVADAVYLLCKDEANWINGAIIPVNGGEHLQ